MKYGKRTGLIKFDMAYVYSKDPCYPASRYLVAGKRYDAVQILKDERIPFVDRLWVVLRTDLASERLMRLFAVWSARQVQHLMVDPASLNALDAVELFVDGLIDDAARDAAGDAARDAAWEAAWDAAGDAAGDAAKDAAGEAAWAAAWAAVWAAAKDAAGAAQGKKLIEMFEAEGRQRLGKK